MQVNSRVLKIFLILAQFVLIGIILTGCSGQKEKELQNFGLQQKYP